MAITTLSNVKTILGITSTTTDTYINTLIPMVEGDYLFIRNKEFELDDDDAIVYPSNSEMTAIRMIAYLMATKDNGNLGSTVASESISRYSVSYNSTTLGYPEGIVSMINRYEVLLMGIKRFLRKKRQYKE